MSNRTHNRGKIEFTPHQLERIKDLKISGRKLEFEIGISAETINRKRRELGLSWRTIKNPKPKTESIKIDKQVPKIVTAKKVSPMKTDKYEQDNAEKRKAEKAKELYNSMEAKQKLEGYKWVTMIGKYGIKETRFIKQ